jgi:hypothetical protein
MEVSGSSETSANLCHTTQLPRMQYSSNEYVSYLCSVHCEAPGATQAQRTLPTTVELVIIRCMHLNITHPHFCKRDLVPSTYTNAVDHTVL